MERNRIIRQTFEYWQSKLGQRKLPSRRDIAPGELRNLLPFLFMADVSRLSPMGTEINLRLMGTHIVRSLGIDLTGCPVGGMTKKWAEFTLGRDFFDAVTQRCAIAATHELHGAGLEDGPASSQTFPAFLRYHRLVLPLSSDGRQVDRIMGALVAETNENAVSLWDAPYTFDEVKRRQMTASVRIGAQSPMKPERLVPV